MELQVDEQKVSDLWSEWIALIAGVARYCARRLRDSLVAPAAWLGALAYTGATVGQGGRLLGFSISYGGRTRPRRPRNTAGHTASSPSAAATRRFVLCSPPAAALRGFRWGAALPGRFGSRRWGGSACCAHLPRALPVPARRGELLHRPRPWTPGPGTRWFVVIRTFVWRKGHCARADGGPPAYGGAQTLFAALFSLAQWPAKDNTSRSVPRGVLRQGTCRASSQRLRRAIARQVYERCPLGLRY